MLTNVSLIALSIAVSTVAINQIFYNNGKSIDWHDWGSRIAYQSKQR